MTRDTLDLSIVVPAYNEAERLPATLRSLRAFLAERPWRPEVVVADDGSTDRTVSAARAAAGTLPLRVISLPVNEGKGAALRRGIAEADGARVGFVDADMPYALSGIDLAMERLDAGADVVIGARDLPGSSEVKGYGWTRRLSGKVYSVLVNALAVRGIPDTQCGFKWFRSSVARELFARSTVPGFAFDVELLTIAQLWGLRIDRVPVQFTHSDASRLRLARDSARMLRDLVAVNRRRSRGLYDRRPVPGGRPA
jgi:dolichyl-phosphate beta-glucosyltransferase